MSIISSLIAAGYYWKTIPIYSTMLSQMSHTNSLTVSDSLSNNVFQILFTLLQRKIVTKLKPCKDNDW